jgi:imidazole glycerol-phosphate synthase subunit HisF
LVKKRLVVSLLWRNGVIVQSIGFKHTNVVGDTRIAIEFFNAWDADEIALINVSRDSVHDQSFLAAVRHVCKSCFLPLSVGGWVQDIEYARTLIQNGADKLVVNTAGFRNPSLLEKLSAEFGAQCIVVGIDVKRDEAGRPMTFVDRGREATGLTATQAAQLAVASGAGEILLTSIDRDGSLKGYDLELISEVASNVTVPVIAFGGVGKWEHLCEGVRAGAEAVSAGNIFHFTEQSTRSAKKALRAADVAVRL